MMTSIDSTINAGLDNPFLKTRFLCAKIAVVDNEKFKIDPDKVSKIFIEVLKSNYLPLSDIDFALSYLGIHGDIKELTEMYNLLSIPNYKYSHRCFISITANPNFYKLKDEFHNLEESEDELYTATIKKLFGWLNVNDDYRFTDTMISQSGHLIHKLKAKDSTGRWANYFVLVRKNKEDDFKNAIDGDGTIDLEDYGKVVASSYGETVTPEVQKYLKEKYNFDV